MFDRRRRSPVRLALLALLGLLVVRPPAAPAVAAETVRAGGTGIGLALLRLVGDRITARDPGIVVEVLPSMGTQGGLRALAAGAIGVAYAARELEPAERTAGLEPVLCVTSALLFATSMSNPPPLTLAAIPRLYADPAPAWPDGRPLKVILRSRAGTENAFLSARIPGLEAALETAYKRPGMPIGVTDQENADLALRTGNSLAIMSLLQLRAEALPLHPVLLEGVQASPETIADGSYPLAQRHCMAFKPPSSPGVAAVVAFLRSAEGGALMRELGAVPLP